MSLLGEIQNAAIDGQAPVGNLLRRCAVLAARLGADDLRVWVANELNGYGTDADLPAYRILPAPAVGNLAGPFNPGYQGITIPPALLPEDARHFAEIVRLRQPISALEALQNADETKGTLTCPWPGNLVALMQDKFNGMVLYGAWQTLSKAQIVGLIDTVRNRVLDFALQLECDAPSAGDEGVAASVPPERVTQLTQTIIYGDVTGNVGTGASVSQSMTSMTVTAGDLRGLLTLIANWGLPPSEISELEAALKEDPADKPLEEKPRTAAWLGKIALKTATGSLKLARGVGVNLIAQAIGQFLGLPTLPPLY